MSQAKNVDNITLLTGVAEIPVASTATVYTRSVPIQESDRFSLYAKAASSGAIDVVVQLECGMVLPTTEEAVDATNYSIPDGFSDIKNLVSTTLFQKEVSIPPFPFMRIKLVGQGSNHASTTVTLKLFKQTKNN